MARAGTCCLPPNPMVLGKKMAPFPPPSFLLGKKNHNYSEEGSFSDFGWGRHKTGHFNGLQLLLIRSLETATVFNCMGLMFYIAALPTKKYTSAKWKMDKNMKEVLPCRKTPGFFSTFEHRKKKNSVGSCCHAGALSAHPCRVMELWATGLAGGMQGAAPSCWVLPHQMWPWGFFFWLHFPTPLGFTLGEELLTVWTQTVAFGGGMQVPHPWALCPTATRGH